MENNWTGNAPVLQNEPSGAIAALMSWTGCPSDHQFSLFKPSAPMGRPQWTLKCQLFQSPIQFQYPPPWASKISADSCFTPDTIHHPSLGSIAKRGPKPPRAHAVALRPKRWHASEALSRRYCLDHFGVGGSLGYHDLHNKSVVVPVVIGWHWPYISHRSAIDYLGG